MGLIDTLAMVGAEWVSVPSVHPWEAREVESSRLFAAGWTLYPGAGADGQMRGTRGYPRMHERYKLEKLEEIVMARSRKRVEGQRLR